MSSSQSSTITIVIIIVTSSGRISEIRMVVAQVISIRSCKRWFLDPCALILFSRFSMKNNIVAGKPFKSSSARPTLKPIRK